jgi:hypothetical protein
MNLFQLIQSFFSQLALGKPVWKISLPCFVHVDKSMLQVQKESLLYNSTRIEVYNSIDSLESPIDRIGAVIVGSFDEHTKIHGDKPFNPVQGEFISTTFHLHSGEYMYNIEQISHTPPMNSFELVGPTFRIHTPRGVDNAGGVKPGLNSVSITFPGSFVELKTASGKCLQYNLPGIKIEPLMGKRTAGVHGPYWIKDASGVRFEGNITKPLKIKGDLIDANGTLIESVDGDLVKGVYFKKSKKLWFKGVSLGEEVVPVITDKTIIDPKYSENVWGNVFKYMRQNPPNFVEADKEKVLIEEKQRAELKEHPVLVSRFGFTWDAIKEE